ncbi:MAG: hypothetical protein JO075_06480 [Acidimicrobiia bacterium]|nr:hypothetical protein [Acidimicrobiia bacterium]
MHVCPECGKKMATMGGLEIHMDLAHRPAARAGARAEPDADLTAVPATAAAAAVPGAARIPARGDVLPRERPHTGSKLTAVPVIALAIVALLVAGVASALVRRDTGPTTPLAMVEAAASTTSATRTAQVSVTVKGGSGALANGITVDGGFDFSNRRATMVIDPSRFGISGIRGVGKIQAIADYSSGFVLYMKFPPELSPELAAKPWVKIDVGALLKQAGVDTDLGALTQGQSNDPTSGLQLLRGADSVVTVGTEEIRGEPTTHYRLVVDLDKAIANAPASQRDALTKLAKLYTVHTFPVDVWLDAQGRVHRFQQTVDPSTIHLPAGLPAQAVGLGGPITTTYELYDFGSEVDAQVPPPDQITDLGSLLQQGH